MAMGEVWAQLCIIRHGAVVEVGSEIKASAVSALADLLALTIRHFWAKPGLRAVALLFL
jgi:hypothetical protein